MGEQECATVVGQSGEDGGAAVAYTARASMSVPEPEMTGSPGLDAEQVVGVPTWLWLDQQEWAPVSAQASVPGGAVSVTAAPSTATWRLGDGGVVVCEGPGTAFDPEVHDAAAESPTCGHTFTRSSQEEPGGVFEVSVEVVWEVEWESSDGGGGMLEPLVVSAESGLVVLESLGVVVRG